LDIGEALAREFFDEVAVGRSLGSDFFAAHESGYGTSGTFGDAERRSARRDNPDIEAEIVEGPIFGPERTCDSTE
jgi:hypothetical protein